ncbi:MAG: hypothetical protein K1000chlam2_01353 [Chlamydiae bacterium]|nr:hypothetical protein [Chlamydiota bacterium]
MPYSDIYLYSPLSIKTVKEGHNRALLLQFILSEIFHALDAEKKEDPLEFVFSSPACFFPYDWSYEVGCLNKIGEHSKLLNHAFPKLHASTEAFENCLDDILTKVLARKKLHEPLPTEELLKDLNALYTHLEPFLIACKDSEDLLLFLFKNSEEIGELVNPENFHMLLKKMFPEGLEAISHLIRCEYQKRGFQSIMPEIDRILSHYEE